MLIFDNGDEVAASEGRGPVLVFGTVGVVAYAAGPEIPVVDRFGLADPFGARLQLTKRGRPGHEKKLPRPWVLARFAEDRDSPDVADAQAALQCAHESDVADSTGSPMNLGRFVDNLGLAVRSYRWRFPANPHDAARCAGE